MKHLLSILLAFAILSQTTVQLGIGVYYHLNKQYIAKQLCENRSNPQTHCNGQCYLSKQLKKAEDRESKSQAMVLKEKNEITTETLPRLPGVYLPAFVETGTYSYTYTKPQPYTCALVFPPPEMA